MNTTLAKKTSPRPQVPGINQTAIDRIASDRRRNTVMRIVMGILIPVLVLAFWEALSRFGFFQRQFIPPPTEVFAGMVQGTLDGSLTSAIATHGWVSLKRLVPGFLLGVGGGLGVGIAMGIFSLVRYGLQPLISATYPIPKIAIFPLLIVIFGIGDESKVAVVFIAVFYMVAINTTTGITYSPKIYREVGTAFKLPRWVEYTKVIVPVALPSILAGVRLGLGNALIVLVGAEFVSAQTGMGYYIWNAWQILDIKAMFGGLIVIAIFGIFTNSGLMALEKKLIPWAQV